MSPIDAETKLYIKEQADISSKESRSKIHNLKSEITAMKFEIDDKISKEREKSDKRYSTALV